MQWLNFPLVKATLFYILGIALAASFLIPIKITMALCLLFLSLVGLLFIIRKKQLTPKTYFGIAVMILYMLLGSLNYQSRSPKQIATNYSHFYQFGQNQLLLVKVSSPIKSTSYYDKYEATIVGVGSFKTRGKILLQIKKDSLCQLLIVGKTYATRTALQLIEPPKNPFEFDYKSYLNSQHIYHKLSGTYKHLIGLPDIDKDLRFWAYTIQHKYRSIIDNSIKDQTAASVLKALLVGYKSDLDPELKESFANAGIMHLLAVSGLHVGIVLLLVQRLFGFIKSKKHGPIFLTLICLFAIWSFAAITGFSASVIRAAFMFSLFTIGKQLARGHNSINSLFISMLIMLCIDPYLLWQVGFQLSYAAVFFILLLYPKLSALWIPKNSLIRKLWQLSCVSISAQLGVLPFSLYYFNEFPSLFLASNIVLVPMIGLLLSAGLILCTLQLLTTVPQICFDLLNEWVLYINKFASWISSIEAAVIENIYLIKLQAFVLFAVIFALYVATTLHKKYILKIVASCWIAILIGIVNTVKSRPDDQLILFTTYGQTLLGHKSGSRLTIFGDTIVGNQYTLSGYKLASAIKQEEFRSLPRYLTYKNKSILLVTEQTALPANSLKVDMLILTNNAKINLDRWIKKLTPDLIIADGSSYKNRVLQWQNSALVNQVSFYNTTAQGAYIFN